MSLIDSVLNFNEIRPASTPNLIGGLSNSGYTPSVRGPDGSGYGAYPTASDGSPLIPNSNISVDTSAATMDKRILDEIRAKALAKGDSAWAQYMLQQQGLDESNQLGSANRQSAAGQAQTLGQLAMRGGMQAGAGERVAALSARDRLEQLQKLRQAGISSRIGIRTSDEANKNALLGVGLGGDEANSRIELSKIGTDLDAQKANQATALSLYDMALKKWSAEQLANAAAGGDAGSDSNKKSTGQKIVQGAVVPGLAGAGAAAGAAGVAGGTGAAIGAVPGLGIAYGLGSLFDFW